MIPKLSFDDNSNRGEMLFFLIYKHHAGVGNRSIWKPLYKSEIKTNEPKARNSAEFTFNLFSLLVRDLCGDDEERDFKIEVFRS